MISKLDPKKFEVADTSKYLIYLPGADSSIDPVFAGRLSALAKANKAKLAINSGYRTVNQQIQLFLARGGKYDSKLGYYWPDSIPAYRHTVAKPGKSFHNFRLAVDTSSLWAKLLNKDAATEMQKELLKFGLFKPMTKGNHSSVLEDWHIQPIETLNATLEKRGELMPIDETMKPAVVLKRGVKSDEVAILQFQLNRHGYKIAVDFDFGVLTEGAVKDFQRVQKIAIDGIVGVKTWGELYEAK